MKTVNIVLYCVALVLPIVFFVGITDNWNEKYPASVFPVCIFLFFIAGYSSSSKLSSSDKLKWIGWSGLIGLIQALALVFLV